MKYPMPPSLCRTVLLTSLLFLSLIDSARGQSFNPDSLFSVAVNLHRRGDADGAVRLARIILASYPRYHDARIILARSAAWAAHYDDALRHLDSILADQPRHREARLLRATVLSWQKNFPESIRILQELAAEEGNSPDVAAELAKVFLWSGDAASSSRWYQTAYGMDSVSVEIVRGLARSSSVLGDDRGSLRWYRRLLMLVPNDGEALAFLQRMEYRADHEILLQGSLESFEHRALSNHTVFGIEYYNGLMANFKPFAHASVLSKFGKNAQRFGAGFYWSAGYSTGVMAQALASPGSSIAARWDGLAEVSYFAGGGVEVVGAYRFLSFVQNDVHIFSPGLTYYFSDKLWLTLRVYGSSGSAGTSSRTGVGIFIYRPDEETSFRLTVSAGSEVQESGLTQQEITQRPTSLTLSAKRRVLRSLALGASYQFSSRLPSNSHTLLITTSLFF